MVASTYKTAMNHLRRDEGGWRLYASAKADVEAKRVAEDRNALKDKETLNGKVRKMGDADLDRELARWVRD